MARAPSPSLLERINPNAPSSRPIPWPLDPTRPERVDVRLLGDHELEAAHLAAGDYCATLKHTVNGKQVRRPIGFDHPVWRNRERVEKVWRAFTFEGAPLEPTVDKLAKWPAEALDALFAAWARFQGEVMVRPVDDQSIGEIIEGLKKNIPADLLSGFPSNWLIAVITTLVGPLSDSPTPSDST